MAKIVDPLNYTSRNAIETYQRCPAERFWYREFGKYCLESELSEGGDSSIIHVGGVRPMGQSIDALIGVGIHKGIAELLLGRDIKEAIITAKAQFSSDCHKASILTTGLQNELELFEESLAIIEGALWVAWYRALPPLMDKYNVLAVEKDYTCQLGSQTFVARVDAALEEKITKVPFIGSWKSTKTWDRRAEERGRHDMQGLSEMWAFEQETGIEPFGTKMLYLLTGAKAEYPIDSGQWYRRNPMIRGYVQTGITTSLDEYAWTGGWKGKDGKGHKLGKGWAAFKVYEKLDMALWAERLHEGEIQPDAGDAMNTMFVSPDVYFRNPDQMNRWVREVTFQEERILEATKTIYSPEFGGDINDIIYDVFRMHRDKCDYHFGGRCPYIPLCHQGVDPLESGLYQLRRAYDIESINEEK